jgi:hypothetical protein
MVTETGSLHNFVTGEEPSCQYDKWISHLAEGIATSGYNVYSPWDRQTNGFGGFNIPDATELSNWSSVIDDFLNQNWSAVESKLTQYVFPYQLVQFNDSETGRTYYMLRETLNSAVDDNGTPETYDDESGAFDWGWGLYVLNPAGIQRVIVTVPNPCDDFITPVMGVEAFNTLNAGFLMIAGAGREVAWSTPAPYNNSKSLSDPTRTANHPFYPAYTKYCTKVRNETGKREFSLQIHSYDSSLHTNYANNQISAGYNKRCPNLPIRDLSRLKRDLVNQADYLMIPANTIGNNTNVYVNNYYTVQYSTHPFTYDNGEVSFAVNNVMDMPAYPQNVLMLYTLSGWNDYDVFEPFFHIEMDEHPNSYTQNTANYKLFYGWNADTQQWDMDNLFTRTLQYYSIWIHDLNEVLDDALNMNDGFAPLPPTNLTEGNRTSNSVTLSWTKADDYDFDTYEILYSTVPFPNSSYSVFSRANDTFLASPWCQQTTVTGLSNGTNYYFRIRAKDKNGNSAWTYDESPVVSNVRAQQRTDGSKFVDILYDLSDADTDSCYVTVLISDNNGISFELTPSPANITGAINTHVAIGSDRQIIWNAGAEAFTLDGDTYKFRIIAEDE